MLNIGGWAFLGCRGFNGMNTVITTSHTLVTVLLVTDCVVSSLVGTLIWRVGVIFIGSAFLEGLLAGLLDFLDGEVAAFLDDEVAAFLDGEVAAFLGGEAAAFLGRPGERDLLRVGDLRAGDRDLDLDLNSVAFCNEK